MAKQVIVLDRSFGDTILTQGLVWIDVPLAWQPLAANPATTSRFAFATSAELAALQKGEVVEVPFQVEFPKAITANQMKAEFLRVASLTVVSYTSMQAASLQFYGVSWDGTTWSS